MDVSADGRVSSHYAEGVAIMSASADGGVSINYVYVSGRKVVIMAVSADGRMSSHYGCANWRERVAIMYVLADGRE